MRHGSVLYKSPTGPLSFNNITIKSIVYRVLGKPTRTQKQAQLKRVPQSGGFRMGLHHFWAEVDCATLGSRNDRWEKGLRKQTKQDRKFEEFIRIAAYVALQHSVPMIRVHIHATHQAGTTAEEIYETIHNVGNWAGNAAELLGMEAWRLAFRPDIPTLFRIVETSKKSVNR